MFIAAYLKSTIVAACTTDSIRSAPFRQWAANEAKRAGHALTIKTITQAEYEQLLNGNPADEGQGLTDEEMAAFLNEQQAAQADAEFTRSI